MAKMLPQSKARVQPKCQKTRSYKKKPLIKNKGNYVYYDFQTSTLFM